MTLLPAQHPSRATRHGFPRGLLGGGAPGARGGGLGTAPARSVTPPASERSHHVLSWRRATGLRPPHCRRFRAAAPPGGRQGRRHVPGGPRAAWPCGRRSCRGGRGACRGWQGQSTSDSLWLRDGRPRRQAGPPPGLHAFAWAAPGACRLRDSGLERVGLAPARTASPARSSPVAARSGLRSGRRC